jgi:hypothetical protein
VDHTSHCEKVARDRGMPRGMFVKTIPTMFVENTTNTNTIYPDLIEMVVSWANENLFE